ncbi:MAG: citrate transporter [Gemmatimonadetes bacterium]|nr:citrate transporter [Gemmatimonadota bacterium]
MGPVPIEFILFGCVLACVAIFHRHTFAIAVTGVTVIALYKILISPLETGAGIAGFGLHLRHEWVIVTNLGLLLLGFALLARHFEDSKVPAVLPRILPNGWLGGFILLWVICILSSFLDNIAAAMIGGAMAHTVFRGKVHVGYLAAIVAASNAGGAGSVIGDTTTTMMWIAGVSPLEVMEAAVGAVAAMLIFGIPAAIAQQKHSPIQADPTPGTKVDWARVAIVASILAAAITMNVTMNTQFHQISDKAPFLGVAGWLAILGTSVIRKPEWKLLPNTLKGTIFLLSLVLSASMMPVSELPAPGWHTAMGLGFLSSVFDNIPLTALTLVQGGYDWGFLAFAVGFGGSMIWFGSSAGVALSTMYPEARNAGLYLKKGWFVTAAYVIAFFTMLTVLGYHPGSTPRTARPAVDAVTHVELPH